MWHGIGAKFFSSEGAPEISQTRSVWCGRVSRFLLKGRWKVFPSSLQDDLDFPHNQTLRVWLISEVPPGLNDAAHFSRNDVGVTQTPSNFFLATALRAVTFSIPMTQPAKRGFPSKTRLVIAVALLISAGLATRFYLNREPSYGGKSLKIDIQCSDGGIIRGPRKQKKIALEFTGHTFAEGGETILNELTKHHAKASFFLTGDFLRNPEFRLLISRMVKDAHYIGPHSDKHLLYCTWDISKSNLVSHSAFIRDLSNNQYLIHGAYDIYRGSGRVNTSTLFWLPAYEHYNQQIADWSGEMGLTLVNYTPGTRSNADYTQEADTNFVSSQAIFDSIVKKEREDPDGLNGFLLLMHLGAGPGRHDKMHARFGELLDYLSAKGYQFVRIDEMFGEDSAMTKNN